jgi:hypothetical protein
MAKIDWKKVLTEKIDAKTINWIEQVKLGIPSEWGYFDVDPEIKDNLYKMLPQISIGSPKQIKWAKDIRPILIGRIISAKNLTARDFAFAAAIDWASSLDIGSDKHKYAQYLIQGLDHYRKELDNDINSIFTSNVARWFIDNRDEPFENCNDHCDTYAANIAIWHCTRYDLKRNEIENWTKEFLIKTYGEQISERFRWIF